MRPEALLLLMTGGLDPGVRPPVGSAHTILQKPIELATLERLLSGGRWQHTSRHSRVPSVLSNKRP